ncbi:MAG: NAD-glutamate dehydrogenase, partial [Gammaproteobacteria bacterium]|nr:NAD-glutamate dehydrogenase [Gammaproteobacteria bacterium]
MKTKWYKQLEKGVDAQASVQKLKVSDETFSHNYQEDFVVSDALFDLEVLSTMSNKSRVRARLVTVKKDGARYSIKLYTPKDSIPLSQSMPIFESMGLQVLIGRPYKIRLGKRQH